MADVYRVYNVCSKGTNIILPYRTGKFPYSSQKEESCTIHEVRLDNHGHQIFE